MKIRADKNCIDSEEITRIKDPTIIDNSYAVLDAQQSNIYHFVMQYNDYITSRHSYGSGSPMTMIEMHTLTFIEDNPGTTVTTLSRYWGKTKSMLSQVVSKLVRDGLVTKSKSSGNAKTIHLYVTEEGRHLSRAHKIYDVLDITKTLSKLRESCSVEELEAFYKVIAAYNQVIAEDFTSNRYR